MQGFGGSLKVLFFTMETTILPDFFPTYFWPCWDGNLRAEFAKLVSNFSCLVVHFFMCNQQCVDTVFLLF